MSWFVYVITLKEGLQRDPVISFLEKEGIPSRGYFAPIHNQSYLQAFPQIKSVRLPVTESVAERTIALPFYNNLPIEQVEYVVEVLGRYR